MTSRCDLRCNATCPIFSILGTTIHKHIDFQWTTIHGGETGNAHIQHSQSFKKKKKCVVFVGVSSGALEAYLVHSLFLMGAKPCQWNINKPRFRCSCLIRQLGDGALIGLVSLTTKTHMIK